MENVINQELLLKVLQAVGVQDLDFSIRTSIALQRAQIETIGKLCAKTKLDLFGMEHFSYRTINEIEQKLQQIGLNLKPLPYPIATKKDCKILPISDVSISFDVFLPLSSERYTLLKRGFIPSNIDQWFIYYERGKVNFCRCSGLCMFSVKLDEHFHKHHVTAYVYNLDTIKEQKNSASETITILLERYCL